MEGEVKLTEVKNGIAKLEVPVGCFRRQGAATILSISDVGPLAEIPFLKPFCQTDVHKGHAVRLGNAGYHVLGDLANALAERGGPAELVKDHGIGEKVISDALAVLTKEGMVSKDYIKDSLKTRPKFFDMYKAELERRGITL